MDWRMLGGDHDRVACFVFKTLSKYIFKRSEPPSSIQTGACVEVIMIDGDKVVWFRSKNYKKMRSEPPTPTYTGEYLEVAMMKLLGLNVENSKAHFLDRLNLGT